MDFFWQLAGAVICPLSPYSCSYTVVSSSWLLVCILELFAVFIEFRRQEEVTHSGLVTLIEHRTVYLQTVQFYTHKIIKTERKKKEKF